MERQNKKAPLLIRDGADELLVTRTGQTEDIFDPGGRCDFQIGPYGDPLSVSPAQPFLKCFYLNWLSRSRYFSSSQFRLFPNGINKTG
jgi:hypothetical protein